MISSIFNLGRYYQAYVAHFTSKLTGSGSASITSLLEDYVFSKDANVVPGKDGKAPLMLSRFLGGFLHPLIHCGYGAEFSLSGLVAEGSSVDAKLLDAGTLISTC